MYHSVMAPPLDVQRAATDLAEACKLIAQMLAMKPVKRTKSTGTKSTRGRAPAQTAIPNMRVNEATGNGYIPKDSSNFGLRAVR